MPVLWMLFIFSSFKSNFYTWLSADCTSQNWGWMACNEKLMFISSFLLRIGVRSFIGALHLKQSCTTLIVEVRTRHLLGSFSGCYFPFRQTPPTLVFPPSNYHSSSSHLVVSCPPVESAGCWASDFCLFSLSPIITVRSIHGNQEKQTSEISWQTHRQKPLIKWDSDVLVDNYCSLMKSCPDFKRPQFKHFPSRAKTIFSMLHLFRSFLLVHYRKIYARLRKL